MLTQPQYPPAQGYLEAHPKSYQAAKGRLIQRIVIHITSGGPSARQTAEYFASGAEGRHVSAHFVVGSDGEVWQCVPMQWIAYHAHHASDASIGIEHCCRERHALSPTDPGLRPTQELYDASARLVAWLCDRHFLPRDRARILGHVEADPTTTHTGCPSSALDLERLVALVGQQPTVRSA